VDRLYAQIAVARARAAIGNCAAMAAFDAIRAAADRLELQPLVLESELGRGESELACHAPERGRARLHAVAARATASGLARLALAASALAH
jgi:hypothetical protein